MTAASQDRVVAFDAGTQSIRGAVIDADGQFLDLVKTPVEPYFSEQPGWAELDPQYYWDKLCETSRRLSQGEHFQREAIRAVAVTVQRNTFVNVDRSGTPLRPAIVWLDQRRADPFPWAPLPLKLVLKAAGLFPRLETHSRNCYSNWIRQHQPEIWRQTHKYLLLSGYLNHRLTDRFVESLGCNYGYLPRDGKTHGWAKKNAIISRMFPIEESKLPELVGQTEVLGEISAQAASETGLPQGLPLIAAASDKACDVLGCGCLSPQIGCISYGTIATVDAFTEKYVELLQAYPPMPSAVPGGYYTEMSIMRGFWMVRWFKEEFGLEETLLAQERNIAPEALFNDMLKEVPPGSDGLVLQPFWRPFWGYCGEEGRGSIIGFSDVHSRRHLYRAIIEGIAYGLRDGAERTQKKLHTRFERLRVTGGGSQSDEVVQITADVFGLPVERPRTHETSLLGAAIDAAVGLGWYPDFESAVHAMTGIGDVFEPIPENRQRYDEIYRRVYQKTYGRLRPLFKELAKIMGA